MVVYTWVYKVAEGEYRVLGSRLSADRALARAERLNISFDRLWKLPWTKEKL